MASSALPLLFARNVPVIEAAPGAFRAALPGIAMFVADGMIASGILMVWPLALFISLGQNFTAFGGAMALAALAGAVAGMLLGRFIDAGHGVRAVWLAAASLTAIAVARANTYGDPALAVLANALGGLFPALYTPVLMTAVYNQAKDSPCALRFHLATEGGWDAGGAVGCLACAGLLVGRRADGGGDPGVDGRGGGHHRDAHPLLRRPGRGAGAGRPGARGEPVSLISTGRTATTTPSAIRTSGTASLGERQPPGRARPAARFPAGRRRRSSART